MIALGRLQREIYSSITYQDSLGDAVIQFSIILNPPGQREKYKLPWIRQT